VISLLFYYLKQENEQEKNTRPTYTYIDTRPTYTYIDTRPTYNYIDTRPTYTYIDNILGFTVPNLYTIIPQPTHKTFWTVTAIVYIRFSSSCCSRQVTNCVTLEAFAVTLETESSSHRCE
jgi:hypothetical protein